MKILWLTDYFPKTDAGDITGGVEARCFYVSKYLKKDHNLKILANTPDKWNFSSWKSVPTRLVLVTRSIIYGLLFDFDVVEGTNFANHLAAVFLGVLKRKPIVCWYPDVFAGSWVKLAGTVGLVGEVAERLLFKLPNINYIAISQTTKEKLVRFGVSSNKVEVIYCGTENYHLKSAIKYDVCAVSRLLKYKHLDDLIRASNKFKVVIVGRGPEEGALKKMAGKNVNFFGFLSKHKDVLKIMSQSKILCHPSVVEGFGIVIIEAMSLGLPVVAAKIPVIEEITDNGKGAILFNPGDALDLKSKIEKLLIDKKLYSQKSREAINLAKKYSWETIAGETEKYYENLLYH